MVCKKCIVSGKVQGVWYRDTTRRKALELAITGHAINLSNGKVEVIACGDQNAVEKLTSWLWEGSQYADVTEVSCQEISIEIPDKFLTG